MKNMIVSLLVVLLWSSHAMTQGQDHPCLFFKADEAAAVKQRALTLGTTAHKLWLEIKEVADYFSTTDPDHRFDMINPAGNYDASVRQYNLYAIAFAYFVTDDPVYLQRVREIIFGYGLNNGIIGYPHRLRNGGLVAGLSQTVDLLWDEFTEPERDQIVAKILESIQDPAYPGEGLRDWMLDPNTIHSNNWLTHYAIDMLCAAIVFNGHPAYPEADSDIDLVRYRVLTYENNVVVRMTHADGATAEGTLYGTGEFTTQIPFMHVLGRWDGIDYVYEESYYSRLSKAPAAFCYDVLPAPRNPFFRYFNPINDAFRGLNNSNGFMTGHLLLGGVYDDGLSTWLFNNTVVDAGNLVLTQYLYHGPTNGAASARSFVEALILYDDQPETNPSSVLSKSKYFDGRGLVYIRTSDVWADQNDIQFSLTASPAIDRSLNPPDGIFSVKHDQPDKNSITLSAYGIDFIKDIGYDGQWPQDQNYLMILDDDGRWKGQAVGSYINSQGNEVYDWPEREGRIVAYHGNNTFDFIHGDGKPAFDALYGDAGNGLPLIIDNPSDPYFGNPPRPKAYLNPVLNADRFVMSVRPASSTRHFFVVADDINKDNQDRQYRWIFNSDVSASGGNPKVLSIGGKQLKIWYTAQGTLSSSSEEKALEQQSSPLDPMSPYGVDSPTEVLWQNVIEASVTSNPYFHTLLLPYNTGDSDPVAVSNPVVSNGSCFKVEWPDYEDYSFFKHSGTISSTLVSTNAKLSHVRVLKSSSVPTDYSIAEGSQITFAGQVLVDLFGATGTVMKSGTEVDINGTGITHFQVYAPNATSVRLNGVAVPFVQVGNHVEPTIVSINRAWSGLITTSYNVTVNAGATLTLQTGARMFFAEGTGLVSYGTLLAVATGYAPHDIKLSSLSPSGTWAGVVLSGTGANGSRMEYVKIDLVSTVSGSAVSVIGAAGAVIRNCSISNNVGVETKALFLSSAGSPEIGLNTFNNNPGTGVYFDNTNGAFYGNVVKYNAYAGVRCFNYASPAFGKPSLPAGYNTVKGGIYGIYATTYSNPSLTGRTGYNDIDSTSGARVFARISSNVLAQRNWWGSASPNPGWFGVDPSSSIDWTNYLTTDPTPGMKPVADPKPEENELSLKGNTQRIRIAMERRLAGNRVGAKDLLKETFLSDPNSDEATLAGVILLYLYRDTIDTDIFEFVREGWQQHRRTEPVFTLLMAKMLAQQGRVSESATFYNTVAAVHRNTPHEKAALLDLFYLYFANQNLLASAQSVLEELQARFADDDDVLQAAWLCELGRGSISRSSGPLARIGETEQKPVTFALQQNYPNPFNPSTIITYQLPANYYVTLKVYDLLGREAMTLVDGTVNAGKHEVILDGSNLSAGVYFYRLSAGEFSQAQKLLIVK